MADSGLVEDTGKLYQSVRERLSALVAGLDDAGWATPVPACPGWSVHDVIAHLAGIVDDALNGRLDGVATDPWTARQVEAGRDKTGPELLAQWTAQAPTFEALTLPARAVADIASHEQDIRGALGRPGARDNEAIDFSAPMLLDFLAEDAAKRGLGPFTVRTDRDAVLVGAANPGPPASLTTTRFELFRAALGRRSRRQVEAMGWTGDPTPYLEHFFVFGPAADDLVE